MKILSDFLFIYILIYTIVFVYTTFKSLNNKKYNILQKYYKTATKKNLCLILYTHNNEQKLRRILEALKTQDYPAKNTSIFVILDHCDDNSERIQFPNNVQKFIIRNQGIVGKKQAISILIEKIHEYSVIDAFIFLDINRYIEKDFLTNINGSLEDNDIVSGSTILFGENLTIRQRIKIAYQKYRNNILERARACADLYSVIDSNICAIKREVIDLAGIPNFENLESDLEYSIKIAKNGLNFLYNPNVKTYQEVHSFKIRIPRLSKRLNIFIKNIYNCLSANKKYTEFTFFQLSPNILSIILSFIILAYVPCNDCMITSFSLVIIMLCALIISFAINILNSKMRAREAALLILYPVYSFFHVVKHFFLWRFIKQRLYKKTYQEKEEQFEIDVLVTDGRGVVQCKLILINECGMAKAKFFFKNKKFTTKPHLRTFDAIEEIIKKLAEYGFTIQICQACSNFTSNYDGTTNLIKGFCKRQFQMSQQAELPVVVWNTCRGFSPKIIVKNYKG